MKEEFRLSRAASTGEFRFGWRGRTVFSAYLGAVLFAITTAQQASAEAAGSPNVGGRGADITAILLPFDFKTPNPAPNDQFVPGFFKPAPTPKPFSIYFAASAEGGQLSVTTSIPGPHGESNAYEGKLWVKVEYMPFGKEKSQSDVTYDGYVWTPRVTTLDGFDLARGEKITSARKIDVSYLKARVAEFVRFQNGYGINLYGAVVQTGSVVQAGTRSSYLTDDGRRLPGRLLTIRESQGGTLIQEEFVGQNAVGQDADSVALSLAAALKDNDPAVRRKAALGLQQLGPRAAPAIPALTQALETGNKELRRLATLALQRLGPLAAPAIPALTQALETGDDDLRYEAACALENLGTNGVQALPALVRATNDPSVMVQRAAARAVLKISGGKQQ